LSTSTLCSAAARQGSLLEFWLPESSQLRIQCRAALRDMRGLDVREVKKRFDTLHQPLGFSGFNIDNRTSCV
jgi:hypothetical protein